MTTIAQQLKDLDDRRRRWMTRLTRAHNAIRQLDQKRLRLLKKQAEPEAPKPELSTAIVAAPPQVETDDMNEAQLEKFVAGGMAAQKAVDELTIPKELRVTADVERLRAERRQKEAAERKKMPLTGKAAMAAIRQKK